MAEGKVILYDIPTKDPSRLYMNFKNVPYETKWLEYPDIAPYLRDKLGLPGTNHKKKPFTIPAVTLPSGVSIMDSKAIALELEKSYPSPPLYLDSPVLPKVEAAVLKTADALRPETLAKISRNLLNPVSVEYFERMKKVDDLTLAELERERGGDRAWKAAEEGMRELQALLREKEGIYFLGQTRSYADIVFVTLIHYLRRVEEGLFERFCRFDPAFLELYRAYEPYFERSGY